jgi:hypothetical protein
MPLADRIVCGLIGLTLFWPFSASAQQVELGGGALANAMMLCIPHVQKELQLNEAQVQQAKELLDRVGRQTRETYQSFQGLDEKEKTAKSEQFERALARETTSRINEILMPAQLKRFKQLNLQSRGGWPFDDPDVQKALMLRPDQIRTILQIIQEFQSRAQADSKGKRSEVLKKIESRKKELTEKIVSKLSEDQIRIWSEMLGEPFESQSN